MSSHLAIYASTVATAVSLARAPRDGEHTRQAMSVATVALDLALPSGRDELEADLRQHGLLGDAAGQFPATPWVLWDSDRIFRLLKSANLDRAAVNALRGVTVQQLLDMEPATILAMLGATHRPLRLHSWGLALAAGLAVGGTLVVVYREYVARQQGGSQWPA